MTALRIATLLFGLAASAGLAQPVSLIPSSSSGLDYTYARGLTSNGQLALFVSQRTAGQHEVWATDSITAWRPVDIYPGGDTDPSS